MYFMGIFQIQMFLFCFDFYCVYCDDKDLAKLNFNLINQNCKIKFVYALVNVDIRHQNSGTSVRN